MLQQDPYQVLGVNRDARTADIKKAYKRLARKFHPDLNKDNKKAEERFKEISQAFDVLGDPEKRKLYDEFGEASLRTGFDPERARQYQQWEGQYGRARGGPGHNPFSGFGETGFNEDMLGDLFGSVFSGRSRTAARASRGADIESELELDLVTALKGGEINISLVLPTACTQCRGSGTAGGTSGPCSACGGTGSRNMGQGFLKVNLPCQACGGTGQSPGPPCPTCGGSGGMNKPNRLKVKIPAGVTDGDKIRLSGKGGPGQRGGATGDLYLVVKTRPHPLLRRDGDKVIMRLPVTVPEVVRGASIKVPTLSGQVTLKIPPSSQNGQKLRLKGKGAPRKRGRGRGDMIVELNVVLPKSGSGELKELADEMERFYPDDVRRDVKL